MKTIPIVFALLLSACFPPDPTPLTTCDGGQPDTTDADVCPYSDADRQVARDLCNQFLDAFLTVCSCGGHNSTDYCTAWFFDCNDQGNCAKSCAEVVNIRDRDGLLFGCLPDLRDQIATPACAQLSDGSWVWRWPQSCGGHLGSDKRCN